MSGYQYGGKTYPQPADSDEAHTRAKFEYFRTAESGIDVGPAVVEYQPAPIRKRGQSPECGTHSGYKNHIITRTTPCRDCSNARAVYQRAYRARKRVAA